MPLPRFHKLEPAKQKELLDAAAAELAEKGYDGASIAGIVERAGASKSAVYYYFEDKEDLFNTVLVNSIEVAISTVGEVDPEEMEADFWGALRSKKRRILEHFAGRPVDQAIWRLAMGAERAGHPHPACVGSMHEEMRRRWKEFLASGRKLGAVRQDLPEDLAVDLLLGVDGVVQQHFILKIHNYDSDALDQQVERSVDLLSRLLSPPSRKEDPPC